MPLTAEEALGAEVAGAEAQDRELVQPGHHLLGEGQQPRQPLQLPVQPLPVPFGGVGGAAFGRPRPHPAGQSRVTGRRSLSRRVPPPSPRPFPSPPTHARGTGFLRLRPAYMAGPGPGPGLSASRGGSRHPGAPRGPRPPPRNPEAARGEMERERSRLPRPRPGRGGAGGA